MYDSGKVITGLVIALVILTFPIWWNFGASPPPAPEPIISAKAQAAGQCVLPARYMKTSHMQILDDWRNLVVRDGIRYTVVEEKEGGKRIEMTVIKEGRTILRNTLLDIPFIGQVREMVDGQGVGLHVQAKGKRYEMSLQNTCMDCHDSKVKFCDQCHDYVEVNPFCWDCHLPPQEDE
jgi:hypothetical protein